MSSFFATQWKIFCSTTGIKAFAFLLNSKTKVERYTWGFVIFVGSSMTFYDVVVSSQHFFKNPTMTQMTVKSDSPFELGGLTLCVDMPQMKEMSDNEFDQVLLSAANLKNFTSFLQQEINSIKTSNKKPNESFTNFVTFMLALLKQMEINNILPSFKGHNWKSPKLRFLVDKMQPIDQFIKLLGASLWAQMNLSVVLNVDYVPGNQTDCISPEFTSFLGRSPIEYYPLNQRSMICNKLPAETRSFMSRLTNLEVSFDSSNIDKSNISFLMIVGTTFFPSSSAENWMLGIYEYSNVFNTIRTGTFQSISRPERLCEVQKRPLSTSILTCFQSKIQNKFGCDPLFSSFLGNKLEKLCDLNVLNSTYMEQHRIRSIRECRLESRLPCERQIFTFTNTEKSSTPNRSSLKLFIETATYPFFEEVPSLSFRQFLGQLGGSLSLWIGGSFLVLLHLVVFLFQLPSEYHKTKIASGQRSNIELTKSREKYGNINLMLRNRENRAELRLFIRQCLITELDLDQNSKNSHNDKIGLMLMPNHL